MTPCRDMLELKLESSSERRESVNQSDLADQPDGSSVAQLNSGARYHAASRNGVQ
jgi:hypothetical protein